MNVNQSWKSLILQGREPEGLYKTLVESGACVGSDWLDLEEPEQVRACEDCPVRRECLDYALVLEGSKALKDRGEDVWGGLTTRQRLSLYTAFKNHGVLGFKQRLAKFTTPDMPMLPGFNSPRRMGVWEARRIVAATTPVRVVNVNRQKGCGRSFYRARQAAAVLKGAA